MKDNEVKLKSSIYDEVPKFSLPQINGLSRAFNVIRGSNMLNQGSKEAPKIVVSLPAKVDYWAGKNESLLEKAGEACNKDLAALHAAHCKQKEVNGSKYTMFQGIDENDIALQDGPYFFKEIEVDGKPDIEWLQPQRPQQLFYKKIITPAIPAVEGVAAVGVDGEEGYVAPVEAVEAVEEKFDWLPYKRLYLDEAHEKKFQEEIAALQVDKKYPLSMYKLDAANLEGVRLSWPDPNDAEKNLEEVRKLIIEHAIVG